VVRILWREIAIVDGGSCFLAGNSKAIRSKGVVVAVRKLLSVLTGGWIGAGACCRALKLGPRGGEAA
jgi:hypothetical protein